jgi:hypothetical protein
MSNPQPSHYELSYILNKHYMGNYITRHESGCWTRLQPQFITFRIQYIIEIIYLYWICLGPKNRLFVERNIQWEHQHGFHCETHAEIELPKEISRQ